MKAPDTPGIGEKKFAFFDRKTSLLAQTPHCLTLVFIRHDAGVDLKMLAERYAASSTTLIVYTSLVCSTAGSREDPFSSPEKGLKQSVLLGLTQSVALPIGLHQLTFQLTKRRAGLSAIAAGALVSERHWWSSTTSLAMLGR